MYVDVKPNQPPKSRSKWQIFCSKFRWLGGVRAYIGRFFSESGIHGFAYLVKAGLTFVEHFLWLALLVVCLGFCIYVGVQAMERYKNKNTVMGLERDFYFWRTSLPSLTMCPMRRIKPELFDKYCHKKHITGKPKDEFHTFLERLANSTYINFVNMSVHPSVDSTLDKIRIRPNQYMQLIFNLTGDASLEVDELERISVTDGFNDMLVRQVLTEFGICYVTNNYLSNEYTARYAILGKFPKLNKDATKVVVGNYFDKSNLYMVTAPLTLNGIAAFIHSPYDAMKIDHNFLYTNEGLYYLTETSEIRTEENFEKETTIEQRNCRFPHESNLTHFPIYTKNFCLQECRIELIYKKCKCIPHFYPNRIPKPKPVCSYSTLQHCVGKNAAYFRQLHSLHPVRKATCYCQPDCQTSTVIVKRSNVIENMRILYAGLSVSVEVQTWPHELLKRQIIYTFTDLLVSVGGAAGLFLGFSVLGAVEFVYYFTLRLIWFLRDYTN